MVNQTLPRAVLRWCLHGVWALAMSFAFGASSFSDPLAVQMIAEQELSFLLPNELNPIAAKAGIWEKAPPGALLTLGTFKGWIQAALSPQVTALVLFDRDLGVKQLNLNIEGLLLAAQPGDFKDFRRLVFEASHEDWQKAVEQAKKRLDFTIESVAGQALETLADPKMHKQWRQLIAGVTQNSGGVSLGVADQVKLGNGQKAFAGANIFEQPELFNKIQKLALADMVWIGQADLTQPENFDSLLRFLRWRHLPISSLDLSNAWQSLFGGADRLGSLLNKLAPLAGKNSLLVLSKIRGMDSGAQVKGEGNAKLFDFAHLAVSWQEVSGPLEFFLFSHFVLAGLESVPPSFGPREFGKILRLSDFAGVTDLKAELGAESLIQGNRELLLEVIDLLRNPQELSSFFQDNRLRLMRDPGFLFLLRLGLKSQVTDTTSLLRQLLSAKYDQAKTERLMEAHHRHLGLKSFGGGLLGNQGKQGPSPVAEYLNAAEMNHLSLAAGMRSLAKAMGTMFDAYVSGGIGGGPKVLAARQLFVACPEIQLSHLSEHLERLTLGFGEKVSTFESWFEKEVRRLGFEGNPKDLLAFKMGLMRVRSAHESAHRAQTASHLVDLLKVAQYDGFMTYFSHYREVVESRMEALSGTKALQEYALQLARSPQISDNYAFEDLVKLGFNPELIEDQLQKVRDQLKASDLDRKQERLGFISTSCRQRVRQSL